MIDYQFFSAFLEKSAFGFLETFSHGWAFVWLVTFWCFPISTQDLNSSVRNCSWVCSAFPVNWNCKLEKECGYRTYFIGASHEVTSSNSSSAHGFGNYESDRRAFFQCSCARFKVTTSIIHFLNLIFRWIVIVKIRHSSFSSESLLKKNIRF